MGSDGRRHGHGGRAYHQKDREPDKGDRAPDQTGGHCERAVRHPAGQGGRKQQQDQGRIRHPAERTEDPCGASEKQAGQHPEGHSGAVRDRCQDRGGRTRALERPVRGQRRGDREVQQEDRLHQPEDQEPGGDPAGHREGLHRHQKRVRRGKPEDPGGLPAVSGGADRTAEAHQRAESGPAGCL